MKYAEIRKSPEGQSSARFDARVVGDLFTWMKDDIPIDLSDISPFEGSSLTDPDSCVRQDQNVVHQHRPFPKGLFVIDLHKLSEVTGDLSPFLFVEMGTTGLLTINPREFGNLF